MNRGFNIWGWLKKYLLFLITKILKVRGYEVITYDNTNGKD